MKKITTLLTFSFCLVLASCNFGTTSQTQFKRGQYPINKDSSEVYLVKVNKTNSIISGINTGYVEDCRMLEVQEDDTPQQLNIQLDDNPMYEHYVQSEYFTKLNKKASDQLLISDARAKTYAKQTKDNTATVGQTKDFFVVASDNSFTKKQGVCKVVNDVCNVWYISSSLDTNSRNDFIDTKILDSNATYFNNIAAKFKTCIQAEEALCGSHEYTSSLYPNVIDPKKQIDIIVYDIFFDADGKQNGGTLGYHYSGDLIKQNEQKTLITNETQCIYIDSYFLTEQPTQVYSTLVHEYNHLLNYIIKKIVNGKECSEWFTEMLSMVTEDLMQGILQINPSMGLQGRFPYFIMCANYGFRKWLSGNSILGPNGDDVLISYANAYIYGAYIGRNFGGPELIHRIATNEYVDEEAITQALRSLNIQQVIDLDADNNPITADVDFYTTLEDEYFIMFNTNQRDITNNTWPTYYTLNNKEPLKWDENQNVKFNGFWIASYKISETEYLSTEGFYKKSAKSRYNARPLYPYGFDINLVKEEYTSSCVIDLCLNNAITYFIYY